jgi:hypothetical protein
MKNSEQPAFAVPEAGTESHTTWQGQKGLTKREYFAAMAMQGELSAQDFTGEGFYYNDESGRETVAQKAVAFADGLLKELEK